eukprot:3787398-Pyramimonas_sp.AAC.1
MPVSMILCVCVCLRLRLRLLLLLAQCLCVTLFLCIRGAQPASPLVAPSASCRGALADTQLHVGGDTRSEEHRHLIYTT